MLLAPCPPRCTGTQQEQARHRSAEVSVSSEDAQSSCGSPVASAATFGHPNLWLPLAAAIPQRAGSVWAGMWGVLPGREPRWQPCRAAAPRSR